MVAVPTGFRRVRALSARTHFVPGHGQVHFDPDNSRFETRNPALPEDQIALLVERKWVADDLHEAEITGGESGGSGSKPRRNSRQTKDAGGESGGDIDQAPAS